MNSMSKRDVENYINGHIGEILKIYCNVEKSIFDQLNFEELEKNKELFDFLVFFKDYEVDRCDVVLQKKEAVLYED